MMTERGDRAGGLQGGASSGTNGGAGISGGHGGSGNSGSHGGSGDSGSHGGSGDSGSHGRSKRLRETWWVAPPAKFSWGSPQPLGGRFGVDPVSSWTGAGSGVDSVSSWTGAGSGVDSVSSWNGAGSGTLSSSPQSVAKSVWPRARNWVSNSADLRAKVLDLSIASVRSVLKSKPKSATVRGQTKSAGKVCGKPSS